MALLRQGHFILKVESCEQRIEEQMKRINGLHVVKVIRFTR